MTIEDSNSSVTRSTHYDDEIVISGVAGRYPDSDNINHLKENLMNKVDLVSDDYRRRRLDNFDMPNRTGKLNGLEKFDADFFNVHFKEAHTMDPLGRMLLEHAYEAIIDAGVNPRQLRGTNTGVFIGTCCSESERTWYYETRQVNGLGMIGCSKALQANRISRWLGVTGPSYAIDSGCSSSISAMENAYRAIRSGQCDAALVGGTNICLHPNMSLQFSRLGIIAPDGRCKTFDADADGYCRSEATGLFYLQKAKDAKRVYATYVHGKVNCDGFKEEGILFPSRVMQSVLLKEFYEECGIPPTIVSYVETHGTGTRVGDSEEVAAIDSVLCSGRTTPLKIGSVKSNLGHAEPASGVCSIAKVIIAMETGLIPPNLHYKRPREDIKALVDGRVKVVTDVTPWDGGYIGVNSFGFGGANAHILLKSHTKQKLNNGAPDDDLPRLVVASGRTDEAVDCILKHVESSPVDAEFVRLIHDVQCEDIPGHVYRGYTIVGGNATKDNPIREIQNYKAAKRSVWFVFSGMGTQWAGMGSSLLRLPVFAEAVRKCDAVLKPRDVDIYDILTKRDETTFDSILNSFVGIAAVQIGLVDLLTHIGIMPDNIIGHSVGELGCAYADGCLTAEQVVLVAYFRGLALSESVVIRGSMAVVGLKHEDVRDICPPDIEVVCHNGPASSTISGPAESIRTFVATLQANKIFAREVRCSNVACHSRYIAEAGPKLLDHLRKVILEPKPRSSKWVSTLVHRSEWGTPLASFASAEYLTNNLLSPVLFEESSLLIPKDAVTIEIAPDCFLQSILDCSLKPKVAHVGLTERGHRDNVQVFLHGLGKLFNVGLHPQLAKLYPEIEFPVSRGTATISPLVKWDHTDDWFVTPCKLQEKIESGERTVNITLANEEYEYLSGHVVDGKNFIPPMGYLTLVWETLGMMRGELYSELSVVFEDVRFLRATMIPKDGVVTLNLMIQKGTGRFEIVEDDTTVVTGMIRCVSEPSLERLDLPVPDDHNVVEEMSSEDVYNEQRFHGCINSGLFRNIKSATIDGTKGTISWTGNWVTFMNSMLQLINPDVGSEEIFVSTVIRKLTIDTKCHFHDLHASTSEEKELTVRYYKEYDAIIAGGIEIRGRKGTTIPRRKPAREPVLESYRFVAHRDNAETTLRDFVTMSAHIAVENNLSGKVKTVEVIDGSPGPILENLVSPYLVEIFGDVPYVQPDVSIVAPGNLFNENNAPQNITILDTMKLGVETGAVLVSGRGLFSNSKNGETLKKLLVALKNGGFLLTLDTGDSADVHALVAQNSLDVVLEKRVKNEIALLLRKRCRLPRKITIINVASNTFEWVPRLKLALKEFGIDTEGNAERIILVSEKDFENGLLGLVKCLQREIGVKLVRGYLIQDEKAPDFSTDNPFYDAQLKLDLGFNVLRANGTWGTYRYSRLPEIVPKPIYHAWVNQLVRGDLSSLRWIEGPILPSVDRRDLARVFYASINFHDVVIAKGKRVAEVVCKNRQNRECPFGLEYAGVDATGRRVMSLTENRAFTNIIAIDDYLTWTVPDSWSLEDAATVPCAYGISYYALHFYGGMKKGEKVLIHSGTRAFGQAAIFLALHAGCEVFTTVSTLNERQFITETFPMIADDHVGSSQDTSFEQMIAQQTKGRGVDIVLNSLAEEKLQASVRCLATGGRFLEIGKVDLAANNSLGMEVFLKQISFYGVMLDKLMVGPLDKKMEVTKLMQLGLDSGAVKPLPRKLFRREQMEDAYRYMTAGKHIGNVIIKINDEHEEPNGQIMALPRFYCLPDRCYVIVGGLGGFGLELVDWLILRGARNLVLTSRTGVKNGYQKKCIELWKSYGANVEVIVGKVAWKSDDCQDILKCARMLGPVDAIFNIAAMLRDALMENQTEAHFKESFTCKAWATKQLDKASRKMCPELRHFVVFSSIVCGQGNTGQTNYGMANSAMERICESRVTEGLSGLAIQWGPVADVGILANVQKDDRPLVVGGALQQRMSSCLVELDKFLNQKEPVVSCRLMAEKVAAVNAEPKIVDAVLKIMGVKDLKTLNIYNSLAELGMDSMMGVEIKHSLEREFETFLTAEEIRNLNFSKLLDMLGKGETSGLQLDSRGLRCP